MQNIPPTGQISAWKREALRARVWLPASASRPMVSGLSARVFSRPRYGPLTMRILLMRGVAGRGVSYPAARRRAGPAVPGGRPCVSASPQRLLEPRRATLRPGGDRAVAGGVGDQLEQAPG